MKHPDDGKHVVVQGGQRISGLHDSEQQALEEAKKLNKLKESQGQAAQQAPPAQVKQNLYG